MIGVNDIIIIGSYSTQLIANLPKNERAELIVNDHVFNCIVKDKTVYLLDGLKVNAPIGKTLIQVSKNYKYSVCQLNNHSLFTKNQISHKLLSAFSPGFLKETITVYDTTSKSYDIFSEKHFKTTSIPSKLAPYQSATTFSENQISSLNLTQIKTPAQLIQGTTKLTFFIFNLPTCPVLSDIDGTLTPHDVLAPFLIFSKLARQLNSPILVTARSFSWTSKTRKFADFLYENSPILMNPLKGIKSHSYRAAGKVLGCCVLQDIPIGYGNTKYDQLAFNLVKCGQVVIV